MARRKPQHVIVVVYEVPGATSPGPNDSSILEAMRSASLEASRGKGSDWQISLPVQTRVYGMVPREIDEFLTLRADEKELTIECHPIETHAAHSAGLAGIFLIALTAWLTGGLGGGPAAAFAVLAAGFLVVEVTRHWAFDALEKELRRIVVDVGSQLWPGQPAQVQAQNRPLSRDTTL